MLFRSNQKRWQAFWSPERITKVRGDLATAGEPYGFAGDAFEPFFQSLSASPKDDAPQSLLSSIEEQFVARSGSDFQMLTSFADTPENIKIVRAALHDHPEAMVISRRALGQAFADAALSETRLLVGISVGFIVIFLLLLTRSPLKSFIIMLPAIVGLVAMLAVLAVMGLSMNVVTVVAAILVLALASDYGVFAVYAWDNREPLLGQGMASVHLCALTNAAGTAAMIFAKHPGMYLAGISLTTGLVAGYSTALFVIPGICFLRDHLKQRSGP